MSDLTPIESYAIAVIVDGAESVIEDDTNEDGRLSDADHEAACDLALRIVRGIRDLPRAVLALAHVDQFDAEEE